MIFVFQEHDALFRDALGKGHSTLDIRYLLHHRMIEEARREDRSQNAMNVIIKLVLRDFSAFDRFLKNVSVEVFSRLLLIQSGVRCFHRRVCSSPNPTRRIL